MSRYSRNFESKDAASRHAPAFPVYSRYRTTPEIAEKRHCHLCDGIGAYAGPDGLTDCDLCEGKGVLRSDDLQELPMFRARRDG